MTKAESLLWEALRSNRLDGWHFRRQQIIQGFIVDFYCHQAGLVIEVDGLVHQQQVEDDLERERILQANGLRVVRFTNQEIFAEFLTVLSVIRQFLGEKTG